MKRTLLVGAVSALFLFSLPACDSSSDEDTPAEAGTFEATVEGSVDAQFSGAAYSSGTGGGWALILSGGSIPVGKNGDDTSISLVRVQSDRPGKGTYSVLATPAEESGDFSGTVYVNGVFWPSVTGNVVVTSSSETRVRGTFGISATNGEQAITIEGSFHAINTPLVET